MMGKQTFLNIPNSKTFSSIKSIFLKFKQLMAHCVYFFTNFACVKTDERF